MTDRESEIFVEAVESGCAVRWSDGIVGPAWHCGCEDNRHGADQQCSVITLESARRGAKSYFVDQCRAVAAATPDGGAPDLKSVRELINAYYEMDGNAAGGALHIVLDDSNWSNDSIDQCITWAREGFKHGDYEAPPDPMAEELGKLLRLLTLDQRVELACSCCKNSVREEGL